MQASERQMAHALKVSQATVHKRAVQLGIRGEGKVGFSKVEQLALGCVAELIEIGLPAALAASIVKAAQPSIADLFEGDGRTCWLLVAPCIDNPDGVVVLASPSFDAIQDMLIDQPAAQTIALHRVVMTALRKLITLEGADGHA